MGIVSGLGRHYGVNGTYGYEDFIQTDAAINTAIPAARWWMPKAGWSASTPAIATESGGNEGIGFAVPVNIARRSMERLDQRRQSHARLSGN